MDEQTSKRIDENLFSKKPSKVTDCSKLDAKTIIYLPNYSFNYPTINLKIIKTKIKTND